jgi:PAS domain S-box-containing protein
MASFLLDWHGRVRDANRRIEQMLGYERDELLVMTIDQLHPANAAQQINKYTTQLHQDGLAQFEIDFVTKDGDLLPAEVSVTMFELGGERVLQGIVRDIRERRRQEQALRHARDDALAGVADEVAAAGQRQPRFAHAAQRYPGLQRNAAGWRLRRALWPAAGCYRANHRQHGPPAELC